MTLSQIWNSAMNTINGLKGSGWSGQIVMGLVQLFMFAIVLAFECIAIGLIIAGIIATQMLLGIAPIFVSAALFGFTGRFFDGWLRTILSFALVPVIVYGFVGFLAVLLQQQAASLTAAGSDPSFTQIAPFALICLIATYLLTQAKPIAASIANGHLVQGMNAFLWAMTGGVVAGAFNRVRYRPPPPPPGGGGGGSSGAPPPPPGGGGGGAQHMQAVLKRNKNRGLTDINGAGEAARS
jgi:type IV secretion system protein VirB6